WQFSGIGNFSIPAESDMLLRDSTTGDFQVYNISNIPGAADLVLRNVNTGQFQVYNLANDQITGTSALASVGLDWQLGGFAPTASNGFIGNSGGPLASGPQPSAGSTAQLVQAMAGFGGGSGAGESLNTAPLSADTSQQPLLTTPQHA